MQPYYLKMLTKQIKVCKGCQLGYGNEVSVPDPLYNICVAHEESIVLPSAAYATKTVAHYHAAPCIWIKDPTFTPHALVISSSIASKLIDSNTPLINELVCKITYGVT